MGRPCNCKEMQRLERSPCADNLREAALSKAGSLPRCSIQGAHQAGRLVLHGSQLHL